MIKTTMIKKYLKYPKQNYLTFDIKYTKKESEYLDNFNITNRSNFIFNGNIDNLDNVKLNNFLNDIGNNQNIEIINKIIHKIFNKITSAYQTKYCTINIRVTLPSSNYDDPRWHKDANFFKDPNVESTKFLTVLKGPGTLFIKKSKKVNEIYYKILMEKFAEINKLGIIGYNKEIQEKYKKLFVTKFKDFKHNQVKTRDGLIFFTGTHKDKLKNGLLHSEPKKDVPRFFISILPGTESQIAEYASKPVIREIVK
jgi:hypothetical protein